MLNLDHIEYVTTYNIWFCIQLFIIATFVLMVLYAIMSKLLYNRLEKTGFIIVFVISFFAFISILYSYGKTTYAKVEITDKEKCIELFGAYPQDRFEYIRSEGDKFYYYYLMNSVYKNEDELKELIEERFNYHSFQADIKKQTRVIKKQAI